MELGDCIYLAMERSQLKFGFMLQPALGNGQETDRQVTELPWCHSLAFHSVTSFRSSVQGLQPQANMARVILPLMQHMCPDINTSGYAMLSAVFLQFQQARLHAAGNS